MNSIYYQYKEILSKPALTNTWASQKKRLAKMKTLRAETSSLIKS